MAFVRQYVPLIVLRQGFGGSNGTLFDLCY